LQIRYSDRSVPLENARKAIPYQLIQSNAEGKYSSLMVLFSLSLPRGDMKFSHNMRSPFEVREGAIKDSISRASDIRNTPAPRERSPMGR